MSYGTIETTACPECGHAVDVIHFETDPPPIPGPYPIIVIVSDSRDEPGSRLTSCPRCDTYFDEYTYDTETKTFKKGDA